MTEERKEALAWWREIRHRYRFAEGSDQKLATLADAFAELHQPDDDEPVTLEWLEQTIPDFYEKVTLYADNRVCRLPPIQFTLDRTTRGELRRVLDFVKG